jgi:hypothetical protein
MPMPLVFQIPSNVLTQSPLNLLLLWRIIYRYEYDLLAEGKLLL